MDTIRDEFGAVDLDLLYKENQIKVIKPFLGSHAIIEYQNNIYYLKYVKYLYTLYNEMLAEFLAKDYGVNVTYNDIFTFDGNYGMMSKEIKNNNDLYIPMTDIIEDHQNNLEDIWYVLCKKYNDQNIVRQLMDKIVNLFIFDALLSNSDRHVGNYGLIKNDKKISLAPIFDNECILSSLEGYYSLGIDSSDYENDQGIHFLSKFLEISDSRYIELIESKLWIISSENILGTIEKIEKRIGSSMQQNIKNEIIYKFDSHRQVINNILNKYKKVKKYEYKI